MPTGTIVARVTVTDHDNVARSGVPVFWSSVSAQVDLAGTAAVEASLSERRRRIETESNGNSDFTLTLGSTVRMSCAEIGLPEMEYTAPSSGTTWWPIPNITVA